MIYRSKAPLRIGLAGGGTDVSPYCDLYGGAILNATISLYAYATIEPLDTDEIIISALDRGEKVVCPLADELPTDGNLNLAKGAYNHIVKKHTIMLSLCLHVRWVNALTNSPTILVMFGLPSPINA